MKMVLFLCVMMLMSLSAAAQQRVEVLMETTEGNIRIQLYDETPEHRNNFMRLVMAEYYDSLLFHRVIKDFMIQGGNNNTRQSTDGYNPFPNDSLDYTLEPEFRTPQLFHKRGAVAAARESDDVNPGKRSSGTQFYIVWGRTFSERAIDFMESRMTVDLTPEMKEAYMTVGGTPHLDGSYTVFGEVVEGLDVVERIQNMETDANDRPVKPVMIIRARIVE